MRGTLPLAKESVRAAIAHRVASIVTVVLVAGMSAAVLLTAGRTAGAEADVLASIDSVGSRTIAVRADASAGLDTSILDILSRVAGVEEVNAFSPAYDVENAAFKSSRVSMRYVYGGIQTLLRDTSARLDGMLAYATAAAQERLGLGGSAGAVIRPASGETYSMAGAIVLPDYLKQYDPLVVVSHAETLGDYPVGLLVVVAETPAQVSAVAEAVQSVMSVDDPSKLRLSTDERVANLRSDIQGQLGDSSREIVLVIYGITAGLVCAVLSSLVLLRRRDYGRRRALGASRRQIIALVLLQTAWPSFSGAAAGAVGAAVFLAATRQPAAPLVYVSAVVLTSWIIAIAAALLPAWLASRRDPLFELRVP